ncbi:MAG: hypothetical protein ACI86M_003518, partial [Saprospiraceae bacterium]
KLFVTQASSVSSACYFMNLLVQLYPFKKNE